MDIDKPNLIRLNFTITRDNPEYNYGDQNKSSNAKYKVSGIVDKYVVDNNNRVIAVVLASGQVFQTYLEDVKQLPFDSELDHVTLLAKKIRTRLWGGERTLCDYCGRDVIREKAKKCKNCKALFIKE